MLKAETNINFHNSRHLPSVPQLLPPLSPRRPVQVFITVGPLSPIIATASVLLVAVYCRHNCSNLRLLPSQLSRVCGNRFWFLHSLGNESHLSLRKKHYFFVVLIGKIYWENVFIFNIFLPIFYIEHRNFGVYRPIHPQFSFSFFFFSESIIFAISIPDISR